MMLETGRLITVSILTYVAFFDSTSVRTTFTSILWIGLPRTCSELVWVAVFICGAQQQGMYTNSVTLGVPTLSPLSPGLRR